MPLIWQLTTPTEPGWYWHQPTYSHPRIILIEKFDTMAGSVLYALIDGRSYPVMGGRWAGPLPEPAEA